MYRSNLLKRENKSSLLFKKNSDVYINIQKRNISKIKELVKDPFIILRDNASYHCSQKTKE